jgi:hypothetical protein
MSGSSDEETLTVTERVQIEQHIHEILATEAGALPLSQKLFSTDGLFSQLARTEDERRELVQTDLFKEAQRRLTILQKEEAAAFTRTVQQLHDALPNGGYRLRMEPSP